MEYLWRSAPLLVAPYVLVQSLLFAPHTRCSLLYVIAAAHSAVHQALAGSLPPMAWQDRVSNNATLCGGQPLHTLITKHLNQRYKQHGVETGSKSR